MNIDFLNRFYEYYIGKTNQHSISFYNVINKGISGYTLSLCIFVALIKEYAIEKDPQKMDWYDKYHNSIRYILILILLAVVISFGFRLPFPEKSETGQTEKNPVTIINQDISNNPADELADTLHRNHQHREVEPL